MSFDVARCKEKLIVNVMTFQIDLLNKKKTKKKKNLLREGSAVVVLLLVLTCAAIRISSFSS